MSSIRQIEANRRNAQNSTGPRSSEGKAVSRFNALKSGIDAQSQVIPGEDAAAFDALACDYHREWRPATPLEVFLVDAMIRADWQLRRLHRVEAQLWIHQIEESGEPAQLGKVYHRAIDAFTRLQRRVEATERSYYRALQQLQRARAAAQSSEDPSFSAPSCPQPPEDALDPLDLGSFLTAHPPLPSSLPPATDILLNPGS